MQRPRFHERLVVRYAVIMAVTMLLFDQLSGGIHGLVFGAFGVPDSFVIAESVGSVFGGEVHSISAPALTPAEGRALFGGSFGDAEILMPKELEGLQTRLRRVATITSWTTTLLVSLLLGAALSWLVTARLERLTLAVAEVPDESGSAAPAVARLPAGLLRGKDEIAHLARVFVASRARIAELLESLSRRDRTRREWIAQASHDLRTPLTALSACLDRANELKGEAGGELAMVLEAARSDCDRLHELTGDLLALARLEAEDEFTPEPVLAGELASRACDGLQALASSRGVRLRLDLGDGGSAHLSFDGDGRGILRVLENLLRNALTHARESVELRVSRTVGHGDERIRFEVLDDGPGFGASPRREPDSSGIGLRVARRFVELHGGALELSGRDAGTCVAFDLPASPRSNMVSE